MGLNLCPVHRSTGTLMEADTTPSCSRSGSLSCSFSDSESESESDKEIHEILRSILRALGRHEFKSGQLRAIKALINGQDVLCSLPPGFGKSLIYQVAGIYKAMQQQGITFIITVGSVIES